MNIKIKDSFGKSVSLIPRVELYDVQDFMGQEMPGLAILFDEAESGEQYAFLTVSFGEFIPIKNSAYIDINNCPFAEQLLDQGIAKATGLRKESGFCTYPLWKFKEDFLQEIGGRNYRMYQAAFDEYFDMNFSSEEDKTEGMEMTNL